MTTRTLIGDLGNAVGTEVTLRCWVDVRRDHGKLIFLDLRDVSGKVQAVALPNHAEAHAAANTVRPEWVLEVSGKVNPRPARMVKADEKNGAVELELLSVRVLNQSKAPPFDLSGDGREISEDVRLSHRYLDLRRPRLQRNIRARHDAALFVRNYLSKEGFLEIETPILSKSTPEGARDFIVPSRLSRGAFYALPQSPQQYKQLLMAAGFERYFQFARCMRDEDTRGDRQPEFTQMDLEMSFVAQEDVMALNEKLLIETVKALFPEKKIQETPFPRMSYAEAMAKYKTDRPDIRNDKNDPDLLAFLWVVDFPFFEKTDKGGWTFTHNPFSAAKPEHQAALMEGKDIGSILTTQYDIVLNGFEIGGGSIRNHQPEALLKVFDIMGYPEASVRENFGHMLEAFAHGTPPHGGIAWGFDRLMALLLDEPNIREVIAFAKTGEGRDLMMRAPAEVAGEQLLELGLRVIPQEKKA